MLSVFLTLGSVTTGAAIFLGTLGQAVPVSSDTTCTEIECVVEASIPEPTPTPTPIPTPTPTPKVVAPQQIGAMIEDYAAQYNVDSELMKRIAQCESKFDPSAVNGPYAGLYQYLESTWIVTRQSMGLDTNPALRFNVEEAIKTTAFKISRGGKMAWRNCL